MDEKEHNPRSARDALMIELIGDLGRVNDQITALPSDIKNAIEGSLRLIADAVEQTEKSAQEVLEKFQSEIKSSANSEANNFKQKIAINEQTTMLSEKDHTKTHNLSVIMVFLMIFNTLFCGCMLGFLFYSQHKYEKKIERYADAYQIQQTALARLPEKIQKQFEEEKRKLMNEN